MGRSTWSTNREKQDLEHNALLESIDGVQWGSQAKVGLVHSNQKSYVWLSHPKVLSRGTQGEGTGRQRRLLLTQAVGEAISRTHFCL